MGDYVSTKNNPCKYCKTENGRHVGCHASCDKYLSWRKAYDEEQKILKENKAKYLLIEGNSPAKTRMIKQFSRNANR